MKAKAIFSKIKRTSQLIDRFKINEESADGNSRSLFQDLILTYNTVVESTNEYNSLKKDLQHKEKSLKDSIRELSKARKSAKKALRGSTKSPVKQISKVEPLKKEASSDNGKTVRNNTNRSKVKVKAHAVQ